MKIGLTLYTIYNHLTLDEALQRVANYGYETVEFSVDKAGGTVDLDEILKNNIARELRRKVQDFGLEISAIGNQAEGLLVLGPHNNDTDVFFKGTPSEKIQYGMERMQTTAQAANALEVPVVCGMCGCEDYSRWFPWPNESGWDDMADVFVERWSKILDVYKTYGVKFAHECHPKQFAYNTETAELTVSLLEGHESWGFNLDPANLMLAGVDPVVFVQRLGDRIYHVHAKDGEIVEHNIRYSGLLAHGDWTRPNRGFRFRVPGWGNVSWRSIITELQLAGYDYVLSVEHEDPTMSREDGIEKGIAYLKPLIIKEPFEGRWW